MSNVPVVFSVPVVSITFPNVPVAPMDDPETTMDVSNAPYVIPPPAAALIVLPSPNVRTFPAVIFGPVPVMMNDAVPVSWFVPVAAIAFGMNHIDAPVADPACGTV